MNDITTPPNDIDAEQSCLGSVILRNDVIHELIEVGLKGDDFYKPAHETIWEAMRGMHTAGQPIDGLTLKAHLQASGSLSRVGGAVYLHDLVERTPTASNAKHYARIVREAASFRRLAQVGMRVTQMGMSQDAGDAADVIGAAQAEVAAVAERHHAARPVLTFSDIADQALEAMEAGIRCTPTPWVGLNHVIDGWVPGCMYTLGARPAVGKTFVALRAAVEFAKANARDNLAAVYYTFEMSAPRLYQRALSAESGVSGKRSRQGSLSEDEWGAVARADGVLRNLPMEIIGCSGWTAQQIRSHIAGLSRNRKVGFVVVDHHGLTAADRRRDNRQLELSDAADVYLGITQEFDLALLACTQLNRGVTQRAEQRPVPSDIRDTDRLEQNSDVVMLLHRDKDKSPEFLDMAVPKNRDGTESLVPLEFASGRIIDRAWRPSNAARS